MSDRAVFASRKLVCGMKCRKVVGSAYKSNFVYERYENFNEIDATVA